MADIEHVTQYLGQYTYRVVVSRVRMIHYEKDYARYNYGFRPDHKLLSQLLYQKI